MSVVILFFYVFIILRAHHDHNKTAPCGIISFFNWIELNCNCACAWSTHDRVERGGKGGRGGGKDEEGRWGGRKRKVGRGGEKYYCSNLGLSGASHYIQLIPPDNYINSQEPTEIRMKASGGKHNWPNQDPKWRASDQSLNSEGPCVTQLWPKQFLQY